MRIKKWSHKFKVKMNKDIELITSSKIRLRINLLSIMCLLLAPIINNVFTIIAEKPFLSYELAKIWAAIDIIVLGIFLLIGYFIGKIPIKNDAKLDAVLIAPFMLIFVLALFGEFFLFLTIPFLWLSFYSISKHTYIFAKEKILNAITVIPSGKLDIEKAKKEDNNKDNYDFIYEWEKVITSEDKGLHGYEYEYEHSKSNTNKSGFIESFFFWITPLFILMYYLNFEANIYLNNLFYVDPKHFPNTLFMVMGILSLPILQIGLLILVIFSALKLARADSSSDSLKFFSWLIALMLAVIISSPLTESSNNKEKLIKSIASTVDFNPSSICRNNFGEDESKINHTGVIYLDPAYKKVLVYNKFGFDKGPNVLGVADKKGKYQLKINDCHH
jgi:hypothetical protein